MPTQTSIAIDLGARSYDIFIGTGLLARLGEMIPGTVSGRNIFVITDENVARYEPALRDSFRQEGAGKIESLILPPGEATKSWKQLEAVTGWLLEKGLNRSALVVALGGGVIGDLAGFAASIVMRGVDFIQVPTTLLAQVDSSVGGKTGINTAQGKNLVGAFYQPLSVIADLETLGTLPRREFLAGLAEVVKYGLIGDSNFFSWLEENLDSLLALEEEALSYAVAISCKAKAKIVEADEKESGKRALLNLGHTFGHALETAAGYDGRLLHGEAVAIGTMMAFDLSVRLGHCSAQEKARAETFFRRAGLPVKASEIQVDFTLDSLLATMAKDKKVKDGSLHFVLLRKIGDAFLSADVPEKELRAVIQASLSGKD